MKTTGELLRAIAELPYNTPLGVEIQTNGGDDLEFTSVDGIDVSSEKKYRGPEITEEVKSVNLIVTSDIPLRTEDDIRDVAIHITNKLVKMGIVPDCTDTDNETEFEVQDMIVEELTKNNQ